jgi:hypothetical protein
MKHLHTYSEFVNESINENISFYKNVVQKAIKDALGHDVKQSDVKVGAKKQSGGYDLITLNGALLCSSSQYDEMLRWATNAIKEDPAKYGLKESVTNEAKKPGTGEIAVNKADRPKVEKAMKDMKLDFVDAGAKDSSSMNYYEIPNADWDILNKIATKVDLQSMTVFESTANEAVDLSPLDSLLTKNGWKEVRTNSTSAYPKGTIRHFDYENSANADSMIRIVDSPQNGVYVELYKDDSQANPMGNKNFIQAPGDLIKAAKKYLNATLKA